MVTQAVSALVVHWQSRLVAIRIAPEPPPAENGVPSTFTVTAHLLDDGAVIDSVSEDEPHASWSSTARASVSATARKDRLRWTTLATVQECAVSNSDRALPSQDTACQLDASYVPKSSPL